MSVFEVRGGNRLKGELIPQGAKNEALQVLSAVLLTEEPITIHNIPNIRDVICLIDMLREIGVSVQKIAEHDYSFQANKIDLNYIGSPLFCKKAGQLRGSIMLTGSLLSRYGQAIIARPGGDKIGRRRLDVHIEGFRKLGASVEFNEEDEFAVLKANRLIGTDMLLEEPSVTGTANIIMAAVLAKGRTVLYNAACEPYIQQLCRMLVNMGACIQGIGSNLLIIDGVKILHGTDHTLLPDMIEVGSFMGLAAMTQSDITIKNAGIAHLGLIPEKFRQLGIHFEINGDDIHIPEQDIYEIQKFLDGGILTIYDHPWPGFTPDLLSIILVVATQARGSVLIHQKMFESRLFFVDKLIDMGAQIILCDPHRATVIGIERKYPLRGITMTSPDIRAGVALLIAALSAEGKSRIQNIEQIDRGYENIDIRLNNIGADIKRL